MAFAKDIMVTNIKTIGKHDPIGKAISILVENELSGAPIVDENEKMVGFVSEYDLILAIHSVGTAADVAHAMKTRVLTIGENTSIREIADLMLEHNIRRVPVVSSNGKVIGIVSRREILRTYYAEMK